MRITRIHCEVDAKGNDVNLGIYKGKVLLIINVASQCDPRILNVTPKLIKEALNVGVAHFVVNGVPERDWHLVKQLSDTYPSVIPNFGLHPWFVSGRSPDWIKTLKEFLVSNPNAAVGEIGLDKGSIGKQIDFTDQVEVFIQAAASSREGAGLILHSYGRLRWSPSFRASGLLVFWVLDDDEREQGEGDVKSVPVDRILLETDAPDARPRSVDPDESVLSSSETVYHPANIWHVLAYVAHLLEMGENEVAGNAVRVLRMRVRSWCSKNLDLQVFLV
ncbi:hypothetical protein CASFOL_029029 [Castilleja foliolosa]|uniref:Glutathione peroxidase n=1 Tax=Castilleja foliolosa TaxID=1961234 RepID=A0ABD3CCV5_9LAMI